jgi:hypothetical protein
LYSAYYTGKLRDQSIFLPMLFHLTLIAVLVALALDPSAKASFAGSPQRPNVKDANNLPFTNAKRLALRLPLLPPCRGMYSSSRKGQNLRAHKIVAPTPRGTAASSVSISILPPVVYSASPQLILYLQILISSSHTCNIPGRFHRPGAISVPH